MQKKFIINPQKKGGVFKSGITVNLGNYLKNKNIETKIFDIDNRNATTARFKGLNAKFIDTKQDKVVLDEIFEAFNDNDVVVVDVGAGTAETILEWIEEVSLLELLEEMEIELIVIVPITSVKDSVSGAKDIVTALGQSPRYVVIKNGYLGDDFTIFDNSKTKKEIETYNSITLHLPKLSENSLNYLDKHNLLTSEAILSEDVKVLDKQRFKNIEKTFSNIFDQLDIEK